MHTYVQYIYTYTTQHNKHTYNTHYTYTTQDNTYTYLHTIHMHICISCLCLVLCTVYTHIRTYTCIYVPILVHANICIVYVCMYCMFCMHTCAYICSCIYMYIHMYVYGTYTLQYSITHMYTVYARHTHTTIQYSTPYIVLGTYILQYSTVHHTILDTHTLHDTYVIHNRIHTYLSVILYMGSQCFVVCGSSDILCLPRCFFHLQKESKDTKWIKVHTGIQSSNP